MKFTPLAALLHVLTVAAALSATSSVAYEIDTHARITVRAFDQSILSSEVKLQQWGIMKSRRQKDGYADLSLGEKYFDLVTLVNNRARERTGGKYDYLNTQVLAEGSPFIRERWPITYFDAVQSPSFPRDWTARGAVREDDGKEFFIRVGRFWSGDFYAYDQMEASPLLNRFCNHFYDPKNNRALTLPPSIETFFACAPEPEVFGTAVKWASGRSANDGSGPVDSGKKNAFSVDDLHEAMWRALTGTDKAGTVVAATRTDRDQYWATAFRSLGNVVHLLQDIGQPQHSRNESHPIGEASFVEAHLNRRALGQAKIMSGNPTDVSVTPDPLKFDGYTPPSFANSRHFYSTGTDLDSYVGKGLSNYSNRSFFTYKNNFNGTEYAKPDSIVALYTPWEVDGATYLNREVKDELVGPSEPIPMTRQSIVKSIFPESPTKYHYTIDERVVNAQADLQIPRAVGYTTGLINFFFRGSMAIRPTSDGVFAVLDHATADDFKKLVVRVRNTTPAVLDALTGAAVAQGMQNGKFVAVVRYHRDKQFQRNLTSGIGLGDCDTLTKIYGAGNEPTGTNHDPRVSTACRDGDEVLLVSSVGKEYGTEIASLAADEEKELTFDFATPIPLAGTDYSLQIVFRGKLGEEEQSIAAAYIDLQDPLFITRHNAYDYLATNYLFREQDIAPNGLFYDGIFRHFNASVEAFYNYRRGIPPPYNPIIFLPTTTQKMGAQSATQTLKSDGRGCWSLAAIEAFPCYDELKTVSYTYTMGSRQQPWIASANSIAPGRFTRIAFLAPLPGTSQALLQPVLVERQRDMNRAFMGEALLLPVRHRVMKEVKWPAPLRDVNSWHSDGYTWSMPIEAENGMLGGWHYGRHCLLAPENNVMSTEPSANGAPGLTVTVTTQSTIEFFVTSLSTTDCASAWGLKLAQYAGTLHRYNWAGFSSSSNTEIGDYGADLYSSFSAWDVYLGTSPYAREESLPTTTYFGMGNQKAASHYAKDTMLNLHGQTNAPIKDSAPVPVVISAKYR